MYKNASLPNNLADLIHMSNQRTVVVAFSASWLGSSEILDVVFEKLAAIGLPDHTFIHLDIEKQKQISSFFQIKELPTFIIISNGEVIDRFTGAFSKKKILKRLELL